MVGDSGGGIGVVDFPPPKKLLIPPKKPRLVVVSGATVVVVDCGLEYTPTPSGYERDWSPC